MKIQIMKPIRRLAIPGLLLSAFSLFAQSPSPTVSGTSSPSSSPRPSPVPIIGYMAGIESGGTSIWTRPVRTAPLCYGKSNALFLSGTAVPTLATVQFAIAQRNALRSLAISYAKALAAGVAVTSGSITVTLAAQPSDQQQFNELLNLLNTAPMPPTLTIADINGHPQSVTVAQYYALVGSYGQQLAALWGALATAKANVPLAAGTAALAKITLANPTGQ